MVLKVKAVALGEVKWAGNYDLKRRRPGEVFVLKNEKEFSHIWMEAIGWTPKPMSDARKESFKDVIKPSMGAPANAKSTVTNKAQAGKAVSMSQMAGLSPVDATPVEVNTDDKTHNPVEEVI